MRHRPRVLSLLAVTGLLLAGCGAEAQEPAAATSSPSAPSSAPAAPAETPAPSTSPVAQPFPANTDPDLADAGADARLTVSDIRVNRMDGYDQVVFEMGGTGTPGWDVRYEDAAYSQGSGALVDVPGSEVLQVTLTGMGYPYDTGVTEWSGAEPVPAPDAVAVSGLVFDATFEGTTVSFVGTEATVPFRVYALTAPTRVVVEVADPG